jgi:hypothetical protein
MVVVLQTAEWCEYGAHTRCSGARCSVLGARWQKQEGMTLLFNRTRVPDRVLEAAKKAGGSVVKIPGEDLRCVRCEYGDDCYNVLNEWVSVDPRRR